MEKDCDSSTIQYVLLGLCVTFMKFSNNTAEILTFKIYFKIFLSSILVSNSKIVNVT